MSTCTTSITFLCERVIKDHLNNLLAVLSLSDMACFCLRITERLRSYCRHFELKHFSILLVRSEFSMIAFNQARIQTTAKYARAEVRFYICDVMIIPAYITMLLAI